MTMSFIIAIYVNNLSKALTLFCIMGRFKCCTHNVVMFLLS